MKAFPDNGSLSCQKTFNYSLSRALVVVVKHAYDRLKGRWRFLLNRNDVLICDVPKLVAACCVLRNVCEIHRETFDEDWISDITENNSTSLDSGRDVRQALMAYFSQ